MHVFIVCSVSSKLSFKSVMCCVCLRIQRYNVIKYLKVSKKYLAIREFFFFIGQQPSNYGKTPRRGAATGASTNAYHPYSR